MKINKISLMNFGSYEGVNTFETQISDDKNIVLVGGKNGAGKTTLFTAIRLCLYGYISMGYKSRNSYYNKEVIRLINNAAKLDKPTYSQVSLNLSLSNGQSLDTYEITRSWILDDKLLESLVVVKNNVALKEDEVADFQKYIFSLIPPGLFNLFFFDGEKIADFFMDEGADHRLKDAFLTLCGYDTFEIMRKNFKRIGGQLASSKSFCEYITAKENLDNAFCELNNSHTLVERNKAEYQNTEFAIEEVDKNYRQGGGITQEEWNHKLLILKDEERHRESINASLKKWANEVIPFLMVKKQLIDMKEQVELENNKLKYENFIEIFNSTIVQDTINKALDKKQLEQIKQGAYDVYGNKTIRILDLSLEKSGVILSSINSILSFDEAIITKYKRALKKSKKLSENTRLELENSNISGVQEYMHQKDELYKEQNRLLTQQIELEQRISTQKEQITEREFTCNKCKSILEADIKKASINDIAAKSIIMLDKLQESLYSVQIAKVEKLFKKEIKTLMRKTQFIDDIHIDRDFKIHIYKKDSFTASRLISLLKQNSMEQVTDLTGEKALSVLKEKCDGNNNDAIVKSLNQLAGVDREFILPIEIDKSSLSNGEKQIFIMALYHSLVQLCNLEIPFVIDTPFARIDTEHRENISKYFFKQLSGQVFILSTNEEINSDHVKLLQDKIAYTYMLENTDNKKTTILKNSYFQEAL